MSNVGIASVESHAMPLPSGAQYDPRTSGKTRTTCSVMARMLEESAPDARVPAAATRRLAALSRAACAAASSRTTSPWISVRTADTSRSVTSDWIGTTR